MHPDYKSNSDFTSSLKARICSCTEYKWPLLLLYIHLDPKMIITIINPQSMTIITVTSLDTRMISTVTIASLLTFTTVMQVHDNYTFSRFLLPSWPNRYAYHDSFYIFRSKKTSVEVMRIPSQFSKTSRLMELVSLQPIAFVQTMWIRSQLPKNFARKHDVDFILHVVVCDEARHRKMCAVHPKFWNIWVSFSKKTLCMLQYLTCDQNIKT